MLDLDAFRRELRLFHRPKHVLRLHDVVTSAFGVAGRWAVKSCPVIVGKEGGKKRQEGQKDQRSSHSVLMNRKVCAPHCRVVPEVGFEPTELYPEGAKRPKDLRCNCATVDPSPSAQDREAMVPEVGFEPTRGLRPGRF